MNEFGCQGTHGTQRVPFFRGATEIWVPRHPWDPLGPIFECIQTRGNAYAYAYAYAYAFPFICIHSLHSIHILNSAFITLRVTKFLNASAFKCISSSIYSIPRSVRLWLWLWPWLWLWRRSHQPPATCNQPPPFYNTPTCFAYTNIMGVLFDFFIYRVELRNLLLSLLIALSVFCI
jgi:hypothetical protein